MALSVAARVENEIGILDLEGTLTLGPNLYRVREAAKSMLTQQRLAGIIVHVVKVSSADSAGLGELTVVYTFALQAGARVAIACASPTLRAMLEVTHLDGLLPLADDLASAKKLILSFRETSKERDR